MLIETMRNTLLILILLFGIFSAEKTDAQVILKTDTVAATCDTLQNFAIPFRVDNFENIGSCQFTITWNPNELSYQYITPLNPLFLTQNVNVGFDTTTFIGQGRLTFSWTKIGGGSVPDSTEFFSVIFRRIGGGSFSEVAYGNMPAAIEITDPLAEELPFEVIPGGALVNDVLPPEIGCPNDVNAQSPGPIPVFNIAPDVADDCGIANTGWEASGATNLSAPNDPDASGQIFNLGLTTVTYTTTDLGGSMATCSFNINIEPLPSGDTLTIIAQNAQIACGETGVVPITVLNFDTLGSLQFTLLWNPAVLQFDGVGSFNPVMQVALSDFNTSLVANGVLSFSWTTKTLDGTTLPDGAVMFDVSFTALGGGVTNVAFGDVPTVREAFRQNPVEQIPAIWVAGQVTIADNAPPTLVCPNNVVVNAGTGNVDAPVNGIGPLQLSDNCPGTPALSYARSGATGGSGSGVADGVYNAGVTTVVYTAQDVAGNSSTCSFAVTVLVDQVLTLGLDSIVNQCFNVGDTVSVDFLALAAFVDIAGLQLNITWDNTVLSFIDVTNQYPGLNQTSQNFNFFANTADGVLNFFGFSGNWPAIPNGSAIFTIRFTVLNPNAVSPIDFLGPFEASNTALDIIPFVRVNGFFESQDLIPPVISQCADSVTTSTGTNCNAFVQLTGLQATDNCSGIANVLQSPPISTFPVSVTTVTYTVIDGAGNSSTCATTVTVTDQTPPVLTDCPDNITLTTSPGACFATGDWNLPQVSDNCDQNPLLSSNFGPGDTLQVGQILVIYSASDAAGNQAACSFFISIEDNEAPNIICPANIGPLMVSDSCELSVDFDLPQVSDNCSPQVMLSGPPSGAKLPLGANVLIFTATDDAGNSAQCSFVVMIEGSGLPQLANCPGPITQFSAANQCGANVDWLPPTATDPCDNSPIVPQSNFQPGDFYPVGTTIVTYLATASGGATSTCSFSVTVTDNTAPTWSNCPGFVTLTLGPGKCDTAYFWQAPMPLDNCEIDTSFSNLSPGATLGVGPNTITYVARDDSGNEGSCIFNILVIDTTPPVFVSCPADTVLSVPGNCEAIYDWVLPDAIDNCGVEEITPTKEPGTPFVPGTTTVVITAIDFSGNRDTCSFKVTVQGVQPFLTNLQQNISLTGCSQSVDTIIVPEGVNFCGPVSVNVEPSGALDPDFIFPLGTTQVTFTVSDSTGITTLQHTFTVNIVDNVPPIYTFCPTTDVVVNIGAQIEADSSMFIEEISAAQDCNGVLIDYFPITATDNCGSITITQLEGPASGELFPTGPNVVRYVATDAAGNSVSCVVNVQVNALPPLATTVAPNPGCPRAQVVLSVADIPGANYTWTGPQQSYPNSNTITLVSLNTGNTGVYTVSAEINGCVTEPASVTVLMAMQPDAMDDIELVVEPGATLDSLNVLLNDLFLANDGVVTQFSELEGLTSIGNGLFRFTAGENSGKVSFAYTLCSAACPDLCDAAMVTITITDRSCNFIPNLISPNGDDQNDYLIIPCLDTGDYPGNSLVIYNQWGDKVFEASPYSNDPGSAWHGTLNGEPGKDLPDGVYFYLFTPGPNDAVLKGFVEIFR